MKFYIATGLGNADAHNEVRDLLTELGHEITYDWTVHGAVWESGAKRIREVAKLEMQGVKEADFVVVLLRGGRGTHAELGAAVILEKPTLIVAPEKDRALLEETPETCAFYWHESAARALSNNVDDFAEVFEIFMKQFKRKLP